MDNKQTNSLTSYEITFTLIGTVIGIYLLKAAGDVTKNAQQDGWISMLLGGLYPLYIVFIASYIIKKHSKDNILTLSKKYLGTIIGNILNFVFFLQFLFYLTFVVASIINMLRTFNISFLPPLKTAFVIVTVGAYAASKGIKTIAKINVIAFYFLLFLVILSLIPLKDGSLFNVMPVGGSGIMNIFKGVGASFQSYSTIEVILLIHPFAQKNVSVKTAALKAVLLICIIYTWFIFITIFYLGIDLIPKSFWPSIMVFQSIHIPLINNFVTVFMLLWATIFFKSISTQYFFVTFIIGDYTKVNIQKICLFIWPVIVFMSLLFSKEPKYNEYFSSLAIYIVIFNLSYFTIIALLIFLKQKKVKSHIKQ
jgi:spore germination protein